jgi:hypothetical protein
VNEQSGSQWQPASKEPVPARTMSGRRFLALIRALAEIARPAFRVGEWKPKLRKPNRSAKGRAAQRRRKKLRDIAYESRRRNRT